MSDAGSNHGVRKFVRSKSRPAVEPTTPRSQFQDNADIIQESAWQIHGDYT